MSAPPRLAADPESHREWAAAIARCVGAISDGILAAAAERILGAQLVLCAGNGGSAALAAHMAQAISKPAYSAGGGRAAVCLSDGVPALTAHANDGGWGMALAECARPFLCDGVDPIVLVAISSSGRSANIIECAKLAHEHGADVIAFTGFSGGPLRELADLSIHVESEDYEVIEPVHDALLHRIQAHMRRAA